MKINLFRSSLSPVRLIWRWLAVSYLTRYSKENFDLRGGRLACFANEEIGIQVQVNGVYEYEFLEGIKNLFYKLNINTSEMVFLDVGANIGNHSIYFSKMFNRVFSFEPNSIVFPLLEFNTSGIKNVSLSKLGLGSESGSIKLSVDDANLGASKTVSDRPEQVVDAFVSTLDVEIQTDLPIGFIKIDVEGMESSVVRGGVEVIKNFRPIIAFESNQHGSESADDFVFDYLSDLGYSFGTFLFQPSIEQSFAGRVAELVFGRNRAINIVFEKNRPTGVHTLIVAVPDEILRRL